MSPRTEKKKDSKNKGSKDSVLVVTDTSNDTNTPSTSDNTNTVNNGNTVNDNTKKGPKLPAHFATILKDPSI